MFINLFTQRFAGIKSSICSAGDLMRRLQLIEKNFETTARLVPNYFHSEQSLRLFPYDNVEQIHSRDETFHDQPEVLI